MKINCICGINVKHKLITIIIQRLCHDEPMNLKGKTKKKGNKICPAGIAWAKRTFDTYPSAYANMAASKYCKDPNYAKGSKKK